MKLTKREKQLSRNASRGFCIVDDAWSDAFAVTRKMKRVKQYIDKKRGNLPSDGDTLLIEFRDGTSQLYTVTDIKNGNILRRDKYLLHCERHSTTPGDFPETVTIGVLSGVYDNFE